MIVNVVYETSGGELYDLQLLEPRPNILGTFKRRTIQIKDANFHAWEYAPDTQDLAQGVKVSRMYKGAVSYSAKLYVVGSLNDRREILDEYHRAFERDVRANTPGKLIWNDEWYIPAYVVASSTYADESTTATVNDIEIYCPYPFWLKDVAFNYSAQAVTESEYLDYEYDYQYDYMETAETSGAIRNDGAGDAYAKIIFYGPVANPWVRIAGKTYSVDYTIAYGETVTIDQREKTVTLKRADGREENLFNYRGKYEGYSVFDPVPVGDHIAAWGGAYKVKVIVQNERSEPAWN